MRVCQADLFQTLCSNAILIGAGGYKREPFILLAYAAALLRPSRHARGRLDSIIGISALFPCAILLLCGRHGIHAIYMIPYSRNH